jgi:tRNA1Val (adenine37-N6)-methyltransferase
MGRDRFQFKEFLIRQDKTAMKIGVDSVLLGSLASFYNPKLILDIGAGTGVLSLMSEQRTGSRVIGVEINADAYEQCVENIDINDKNDKIFVYHTSFQKFSSNTDLRFDHIISNPPFFNKSTKPSSDSLYVAKHTGKLSHQDLLKGVSEILCDSGIFSVIIPFENKETFIKIADDYNLNIFNQTTVYPKQNKKPNRSVLEFSKTKRKQKSGKICIRDIQTNEYTETYKRLTADFYLNLNT